MRRSLRLVLGPALLGIALAAASSTAARARVVMRPPPRFDSRVNGAVVSLRRGPPPISGGTLLTLADGHRVVVADPDRDRVSIVDLDAASSVVDVGALEAGAQPGRSVQDAAGRVHTVLRGASAILDVDLERPEAATRRRVCPMPRGIAFDPASDALHVACAGGELVTLPAAGGAATRTVRLAPDLRDVVVAEGRLYVTRFRSAEVLLVGHDGRVIRRLAPRGATHDDVSFAPRVAWRALAAPDGKLVLLHQRESEGEIVPSFGGYGFVARGECSGIVRGAVSSLAGGVVQEGPELSDLPLAVDLAIEPGRNGRVAVVSAGNQSGLRSVVLAEASELSRPGCLTGAPLANQGSIGAVNAVAVTFASDRRVVVQQRDPARLLVYGADGAPSATIELGGASAFDTGHAIFHASTANGIACASCHPEGADDGHVWRFREIGARRTPPLHAAAGSAPFHWSGDIEGIEQLMGEVFVRRMGGSFLDRDHAASVEAWLEHVPAPRSGRGDAEAIARGRALFVGEAGCADCHSGPRLSNGLGRDVGTGAAFQVPSLVGVAHRLPLMHDGCATTLRGRFEPECGGERHGPALTEAQLSDMIAYLESL